MKNENKYKSIEAERFIIASQEVINSGFARSFKEMAEKSGYSSQDYTDIKSGKKDLQRKFLEAIVKTYPINDVFILTGSGDIIKEKNKLPDNLIKEIQSNDHPDDFKQKEIEMWKELYRLQGELMDEIKKERDRLQKMLDENK